jgi:hypothetical protein
MQGASAASPPMRLARFTLPLSARFPISPQRPPCTEVLSPREVALSRVHASAGLCWRVRQPFSSRMRAYPCGAGKGANTRMPGHHRAAAQRTSETTGEKAGRHRTACQQKGGATRGIVRSDDATDRITSRHDAVACRSSVCGHAPSRDAIIPDKEEVCHVPAYSLSSALAELGGV